LEELFFLTHFYEERCQYFRTFCSVMRSRSNFSIEFLLYNLFQVD
jgi:hypothetical protein